MNCGSNPCVVRFDEDQICTAMVPVVKVDDVTQNGMLL